MNQIPKINGLILVNKPTGLSSNQTIQKIKKYLPKKTKIGYAGTLDPFAEGLLPVAIGNATRILEYLSDNDKEYIATIKFGTTTDTLDHTGNFLEQTDKMIKETDFDNIITNFIGKIEQVPPKYSAIKINGKRAYELARAGLPVEIQPRMITIYNIEKIHFDYKKQEAIIKVNCSKGTYIRTLANDIALKLNNLAYLTKLIRTKVGKFSIEETFLLEKIINLIHNANHCHILSIKKALDDIPALLIDEEQYTKITKGQQLLLAHTTLPKNCNILVIYNNEAVAIAKFTTENMLQPIKVFNNL